MAQNRSWGARRNPLLGVVPGVDDGAADCVWGRGSFDGDGLGGKVRTNLGLGV